MPNNKSDSVEMQLPELPENWKPPLEPCARHIFAFICTFTLRQPGLEGLWQEVRGERGWQKYNDRLCDEAVGLHVGQALICFASMACIRFPPPGAQNLDATSVTYCLFQLYASFLFSVMGLFSQMYFISSASAIELYESCKKDKKPFELGRYKVLYHVGLFRMAQFFLAYSLAFILSALSIIALGVTYITSLAAVVTLSILLDAVFVKHHVGLACFLFASMWFSIFAHYKLFIES